MKIVKTPTVLQMEVIECGAASLGMILGFYGCHAPLEELRIRCGVSRDGANLAKISDAAESYGCNAAVGFFNLERLKTLELPVIIYWNHNHFMVLEGFKRGKVYLNDPALGRRSMDEEAFTRGYSQVAIQIRPDKGFKKRAQSENVLKEIYTKIRTEKYTFIFLLSITLLLTIPTLATPIFSQIFIDNYLINDQKSWINSLIAIMLYLLMVQFIFIYLKRVVLKKLETKMSLEFNKYLVVHMLKLPMVFFAQRHVGDLITRLQSNDNLAKILSGPLGGTLVSLWQVGIYFIAMVCYSPTLAIISLMLVLVNIACYYLVREKRKEMSIEIKQANGRLTTVTMNAIRGMENLKASGRENDLFCKWQNQLINYLNVNERLNLIDLIVGCIPTMTTTIANVFILGLGAMFAINGHLTVGGIVAFQALFLVFNEPVKQFSELGGQIQLVEADFKRVNDVFHYQESTHEDDKNNGKELFRKKPFKGSIELKNITFSYSPLEKPFIKNLSLKIKPGSRVAFVGLSGSGKSTLAKIISGLYPPNSGEVIIDDVNQKDISRRERANYISVVSQDEFFFKGSISENLSLWGKPFDEAELIKASKAACIFDLISGYAKGFQAQLEEGATNISGGQRQRLEITRALLKSPKVLILDEATSALDALVEEEVSENINALGITTISIAHRLSTIRGADVIYVFKDGEIIQQGTHEQLKTKCKLYQQLIGIALNENEKD